tara:strand:- start:1989 stop:2528 length:540 start_codon:yes stop_codon:yes gene_type:complete
MFKSSSQLLAVILGFGLISSNFFTLMILARKDSGIPNLAALPSNKYSSFSIRSEKEGNKHSWTMASNQHDPAKLLYSKQETRPGFKGTTEIAVHKETVALERPVYTQEEREAIDMACLEAGIKGEANGEIIGSGIGAAGAPAISQLPIVGPVFAGLFFGQARKISGNLASDVARDWNDC